jgi:hypothetical protein
MMNETNTLPEEKIMGTSQLQISHPSLNTEALIISLPFEKKLPLPLKEFPLCKWTMPPEPQGYIQGHENDCL